MKCLQALRRKQTHLSILLVAASLIASATDFFIATSDVNIRTGAGKGYSVSFTIQRGTEVEVLSKSGEWYQISYLGKTGYAHEKYLKYIRSVTATIEQPPQQTELYFFLGVFVCLILFGAIYFLIQQSRDKKLLETVTESNRGIKSERDLVLKFLKSGMPADVIFHDLYVKKQKGDFSQIDLVIVSDVGIIVFEVKDYSGWIFGRGNQSHWTQVLAYGKRKYRFYNPIMQNNRHVLELKKQLTQFENIPFYSVVVFYGNCVLKEINFVPHGTYIVKSERVLDALKTVFKEKESVQYDNVGEVFRVLKESVTNGGIIENQIQHRENIKNMLGKHRIFE